MHQAKPYVLKLKKKSKGSGIIEQSLSEKALQLPVPIIWCQLWAEVTKVGVEEGINVV